MNKIIIAFFVLFIFLNLNLYGQEVLEENKVDVNEEDLGFEIEEDDGADVPETTFLSYWDEHFSLGLVSSSAIYNSGMRFYNFIGLSYEEKLSILFFKFAGDLQYKYSEIALVSKKDKTIEKNFISKTDFKKNFFTLRDLYLQLDLFSIVKFTAGRKLIVWGQFDIISPVDFVLPFSFNTSSVVINKVANRLPQDVVQLDIIPVGFLQFQFYWFPNYTTDDVAEDFFSDTVEFPKGLFHPSLQDGWYGNLDAGQYAVRALGYFGNFTLGLTYMYTWDLFNDLSSLDTLKNNPAYDSSKPIGSENFPYTRTRSKRGPTRTQNVGIEMSLQTGRWTWKAEAMYNRLEGDIRELWPFLNEVDYPHPDYTPAEFFTLANLIINENEGKLYNTINRVFAGIGTTGELERWKLDFVILTYRVIRDDKIEEAEELSQQIEKNIYGTASLTEPLNPPVIPSINVVWYSVPSKKGSLGFAGGFISIGYGGLLYYIHEIAEIVTLGASIEFLAYLNPEEGPNFEFEPKDTFNYGGRFVASLRL